MKAKKAASNSSTTSAKPVAERAVPGVATAPQAITLEPVFAALRKRYPAARQSEVQLFAADFYRRMEEDEFPNHPPEQWAALAADMLEFARTRNAGTVNVRVFNPTLKSHGYESPHTLLQIVNDDMPFLVDSVSMTLSELGIGVHVLGHPVLRIARDKGGKLTAVGEGKSESLMVLEIDRQPADEMPKVEAAIRKVLAEVRAIVHDWAAMREKMVMLADDLATRRLPMDDISRHEAQEFLRWAASDHFTFFGYREYRVEKQDGQEMLAPVEESGLGLMRGHDISPARPVTSLAAHGLNTSAKLKDALILTKTNARSRVHRVGYMDYIGILEFDAKGRIVGEQRFLGLFTSSAYNRRPWEIPLVRQRYEYVMSKSGLTPSSHSGKALRHILETLPREELFQSNQDELYRTAIGILGLQERVRSRMFLRRDKYSRFISALVYIPRERFNTDVRLRIEALLKDALHGEYIDSSVVLGESPLAQLHLIVRAKSGEALEFDTTALEARLAHVLRNWHDALREALVARHGEAHGLRMAANFGRALPAGYIEDSSIESAVADVEHLAALDGPNDLHLSLQEVRRDSAVRLDTGDGLRLKLYRQLDDIPLSDAMPMMENMGLRVISERPYRLQVSDTPVYIQDFEVESTAGHIDASSADAAFGEAFERIWNGDAENDGFNRLILAAGLHWRQVALLRGYCKYLLQTATPFSQAYVEATFTRYPLLARLLVELFEARFDPSTGGETKAQILAGQERLREQLSVLADGDEATLKALEPVLQARGSDRAAQQEATRATLLKLMDRVSSLDEDRILRSFIDVIDATLRTNYYQTSKDGKHGHCISFKLDSSLVPDLPKPRPYRGSSSTARAWKVCTCALARWRVAACVGRTAARISVPRCWAWSRRRWSRTPSSCRSVPRAVSTSSARRWAAIAMRSRPKASPATSCLSRACWTLPTTLSAARSCRRRRWCVMTRTTRTWWWRPTRARRLSPTWPMASRWTTASGWVMHSPPVARSVTTTRAWASPRAVRGSRSNATSVHWDAIARARISAWSASVTCPATCSATACCCRATSACWRRSITGMSSWTRTRMRPSRSPNVSGCSRCRVPAGPITTPS